MPAHWTLFCSMVDNYGDIGVCWRLACQLQREHGLDIDLWVDDWSAASRFLTAQQPDLLWPDDTNTIRVSDISVWHWQNPWPDNAVANQRIAASGVVIEAFGCELPEAVKLAMANTQTPLLWLNLEYLSAEPWVSGCHGLPSPHAYAAMTGPSLLRKFFFFPGFEPTTGGLLRETGLQQQHANWQAQPERSRIQLMQVLGLTDLGNRLANVHYQLMVSLFSYETPALTSWLTALAEGPDSVLCLIPQGRSLVSVAPFLGDGLGDGSDPASLQPGKEYQRGNLTLVVLPFMSQDFYDQLLSVCDFNVVRGEDSFVRAQWAAKPFLWHIYPQEDGVHMSKLQAFADCYLQGLPGPSADTWRRFAEGWNLGEDCREMWHYLRPQLPDLLLHSREWQKKLAVMPDLATNLVNFEPLFKLSAHP